MGDLDREHATLEKELKGALSAHLKLDRLLDRLHLKELAVQEDRELYQWANKKPPTPGRYPEPRGNFESRLPELTRYKAEGAYWYGGADPSPETIAEVRAARLAAEAREAQILEEERVYNAQETERMHAWQAGQDEAAHQSRAEEFASSEGINSDSSDGFSECILSMDPPGPDDLTMRPPDPRGPMERLDDGELVRASELAEAEDEAHDILMQALFGGKGR